MMYRLTRIENAEYLPHTHPHTFVQQTTPSGPRLVAAPANGHFDLLFHLAGGLTDPCSVLWVLHVSRGRADEGRYQSPFLPLSELRIALEPFRSFFSQDGRSQLWLHSGPSEATLVWDHHDLLYLYGAQEQFRSVLLEAGLREAGPIGVDFPHGHHYHAEFDDDEESMAAPFDWRVSPLRPEDDPRREPGVA